MQMIRKIISAIVILTLIIAVPAISLSASGSDTVTSATKQKAENTASPNSNNTTANTKLSDFSADIPYTLEEMLIYSIKDEYAAQALYNKVIFNHGSQEPFERLFQEESDLIGQLTMILAYHGIVLPDMTAISEQPNPTSTREAGLAAIRAEKIGIEMYMAFLAKNDLPDNVRVMFQQLLSACQNHLYILDAKALEEGWIQGVQYQDDHDDRDDRDDEDDEDDEDDRDDEDDDD